MGQPTQKTKDHKVNVIVKQKKVRNGPVHRKSETQILGQLKPESSLQEYIFSLSFKILKIANGSYETRFGIVLE